MVYTRDSNVQGNRILNAMSNADLTLLQPHLEKCRSSSGNARNLRADPSQTCISPTAGLPPLWRWGDAVRSRLPLLVVKG